MAKPLTEAQRAFITKYITGKSKGQAGKITKAYQDFDRRREKVAAALAKLQPTDPDRQRLQALLDGAMVKAKGPNDGSAPAFDAAYADLEAVKREAVAKAKGYVSKLSGRDIADSMARIANELIPITLAVDGSKRDMQTLLDEMEGLAPPVGGDYDAIVTFRQDVTNLEARWRGEMANAQGRTAIAVTDATALGVEGALARVRHEVEQFQQSADKKTKAEADRLANNLRDLDGRARLDGAYYAAAVIQAPFNRQAQHFETVLKKLKTFQNRENSTDTGDRFKHLEDRENAMLGQALESYKAAHGNDEVALNPRQTPGGIKPKQRPVLRKFVTSDLVPDDIAMLDEYSLDDPGIANAAARIGEAARNLIVEEAKTPNSDVLFDMALRSLNDLRAEIGAAMGLLGDVTGWPPKQRALAEAAAKAVKDACTQGNPNKTSDTTVQRSFKGDNYDVPEKVSANGVEYSNPEIIGKGGLGLITRYQGPMVDGQPSTVVMKSTNATSSDELREPDQESKGKARKEMVSEMQMHRVLMGGETGQPDPNVIAMKGAAVGSDGSLHMIMEEAQAGDADNFNMAIANMVSSGILPKSAQQAMQQDTMLQAVKGLKAMHDTGVQHNDIKAVNFLVDLDGTLKVSDFGSSEEVDSPQDDFKETTDRYASPDYYRNRSEKSDIHALGAMLHLTDLDIGVGGSMGMDSFSSTFSENAKTGHGVTSLDRLRNAMMDNDPNKRPTLEGVLMSSYLNDARDTYGDPDGNTQEGGTDSPDLTALRKAIAAYTKAVGREIGTLTTEMNGLKGQLRAAEQKAQRDPNERPELEQLRQTNEPLIAGLQAQLDAINARPEIARLIEAIQAAGKPFGTAKGNERENAWDFAYRKTMKGMEDISKTTPELPEGFTEELRARSEEMARTT